MKRFLFSMILVFEVFFGYGQQQYFVFIQDTGGNPFYVRAGEESFSSTAGGHIILSKLHDSTYTFFLGFPQERDREQEFIIRMYSRDRGYELRKVQDRWKLFDLQTLEYTAAEDERPKVSLYQSDRKTDTYSQLMAGVVKDTSVLYENVHVSGTLNKTGPAVPKPDSGAVQTLAGEGTAGDGVVKEMAPVADQGRVGADSTGGDQQGNGADSTVHKDLAIDQEGTTTAPSVKKGLKKSIKESEKPDSTAVAAAENAPKEVRKGLTNLGSVLVSRYSTENIAEGKLMIYIDRTTPVADTIRLIIPRL